MNAARALARDPRLATGLAGLASAILFLTALTYGGR